MEIVWELYGDYMEMKWKFYGIYLVIHWELGDLNGIFHGNVLFTFSDYGRKFSNQTEDFPISPGKMTHKMSGRNPPVVHNICIM